MSYSGLPSPQRLLYNRAQQAILEGKILEGRASRQPGIQGSLGPEPVHGLLPVPLIQLLWVSSLSGSWEPQGSDRQPVALRLFLEPGWQQLQGAMRLGGRGEGKP